MVSDLLKNDLNKLWPIIEKSPSDSATFDNALELLVMSGYSLPHAMMLMIPEAWKDNALMDPQRRSFYEYYSALMEPWDGPAAMAFTDGVQIAATLDRNGLRPARYIVTDDDLVIMSSEVGVLQDIPESKIVKKWRLQPGKMLLVDLEQKRIISDEELKNDLVNANPYQDWINTSKVSLSSFKFETNFQIPDNETLLDLQQAHGYNKEDLKFFLEPMIKDGQDPIGSMGRDIPLAALSDKNRLLYDYFFQTFAQVTNPPIDPIREELVMSLLSFIGPRPNLLDPKSGEKQKL
jgi:glutamate synthase (NADPH/NADH) large chain